MTVGDEAAAGFSIGIVGVFAAFRRGVFPDFCVSLLDFGRGLRGGSGLRGVKLFRFLGLSLGVL